MDVRHECFENPILSFDQVKYAHSTHVQLCCLAISLSKLNYVDRLESK